jgi:Zn-dependent membrane protease YugP
MSKLDVGWRAPRRKDVRLTHAEFQGGSVLSSASAATSASLPTLQEQERPPRMQSR